MTMTDAAISTQAGTKKILFHLLGDRNKASSRVRGYWIAEELEALGHKVSFFSARSRFDYLRLLALTFGHDVVIFQKMYSRYDVVVVRIARLLGKRVFFDIDDAPSRTQKKDTLRNAAAMIRLSDGVFAGSHSLAEMTRSLGGVVHFIPSGIRLQNYSTQIKRDAGPAICLGWIGNGAHYVDDLAQILEHPLRELARTRYIRLKIVGACGQQRLVDVFGSIDGLELELVDQIEWSDPQAVTDAVADFDIGLYPLLGSEFNIHKCAFKALEYMAVGIPVIASKVGANADVITHDVDGYLAETQADWVRHLSELIDSGDVRRNMGQAGHRKVVQDYNTATLARQIAEVL